MTAHNITVSVSNQPFRCRARSEGSPKDAMSSSSEQSHWSVSSWRLPGDSGPSCRSSKTAPLTVVLDTTAEMLFLLFFQHCPRNRNHGAGPRGFAFETAGELNRAAIILLSQQCKKVRDIEFRHARPADSTHRLRY